MYVSPEEDWLKLARHGEEACITRIQPLAPEDPDRNAIRIELRNARGRIDAALEERGMDREEREQLLAPISWADHPSEIPRDGRTLLALLSPSLSRVCTLEAPLKRRVEVDDHFVLSDLAGRPAAADALVAARSER